MSEATSHAQGGIHAQHVEAGKQSHKNSPATKNHHEAASLHKAATHSHHKAAEHHESSEDNKAKDHSSRANAHSTRAHELSQQAHDHSQNNENNLVIKKSPIKALFYCVKNRIVHNERSQRIPVNLILISVKFL